MKKYLLILVLFASCTTQKKAEKYYSEHPEKLAKQCADKFPVDTVFKQGQTIIKSDTTIIKGDSVPCPPSVDENGDTVFVKVKCPDSKIIHDTTFRVDTFKLLDNARQAYFSYKADSLNRALIQTTAQKNDASKTAANRLWLIIGLLIALGISIYINIKKQTK